MKVSQTGIDLIKHWEQFRAKPYLDQGGRASIGYGTIRYEDGTLVTMNDKPITEARATELLLHHLPKLEEHLNALLSDCPNKLSQNAYDSLVDFCYNLGTNALASSTLLKLLKAGTPAFKVAAEFAKWNKVRIDGKLTVSKGLTARRAAEAELFLKA